VVQKQLQGQDLLFRQHLAYSYKPTLLHSSKHHFLHSQTKDCTFCNTNTKDRFSNVTLKSDSKASPNQLELLMQEHLSKRHATNKDYYNVKIVNDLIYNENTHVVSVFKDFLIMDDINEFLKRVYAKEETKTRVPKLCSFYEMYSQVFPNYVCLPESKYMFKNIQRKRKLIDDQYQHQEVLAKRA